MGRTLWLSQPSCRLPKGWVRGTVGAGDAFCAGILYGLREDFSPERLLQFANCAAALSLRETDSVSGMECRGDIEEAMRRFYGGRPDEVSSEV